MVAVLEVLRESPLPCPQLGAHLRGDSSRKGIAAGALPSKTLPGGKRPPRSSALPSLQCWPHSVPCQNQHFPSAETAGDGGKRVVQSVTAERSQTLLNPLTICLSNFHSMFVLLSLEEN